jgi:phenylacetate-coenzyme A ligase PaaK-like adenylate-forming protein
MAVRRVFDILNVKDKQILPVDVENTLRSIRETASAGYMVVRYSIGAMDKLKVKTTYDSASIKDPEKFKMKLEHEISKKLGVPVEVE